MQRRLGGDRAKGRRGARRRRGGGARLWLAPLDTGSPTNDAEKCSALDFDHEPIVLSDPKADGNRMVAGLDIDGDGKGITIPEVEAKLCAGTPLGSGPGGTRA